ncbi:HAMP domain-containing protein [bacterium]|nr:HAMP domain-containing protein [bacterium]
MWIRLFKDISIKRKLILINLMTTGVALMIACILFIQFERRNLRDNTLRELSVLSEIISNNSTAALAFEDRSTGEEILSALSVKKYIASACLFDKQNRIFATYSRETPFDNCPQRPGPNGYRFEGNRLIIVNPVILDLETIGYVYLSYDLKESQTRLRMYISIVILVFVLASIVAFAITSQLQGIISKPIMHLSQVAKDVSEKRDYSVRAVRQSQDEIGLLIDAFNDMLSQIQERDQALIKDQETLERRVEERTSKLKQEVQERKKAEAKIITSLKEKDVLLKEIHHRVKNNLQVVSSLLYLQSKKTTHDQTLEMLNESQNRIKSMALIHEKLYQSKDIVRIDFSEYIKSLMSHLSRSYGSHLAMVDIHLDVNNVYLNIDKAIPCGLIINELVSNCMKYAFPNNEQGEIQIIMNTENDHVNLGVIDNGIGFPEYLNFKNTETLGLQLVSALTAQLGGSISLDRSGGTRFTIQFSAEEGQ